MTAALSRRYRRLLLAYPARYRRSHGTEILTTLMDGAGTGRDRPTAGEVRDIVAGGLRQRLRLPVGRIMVVAAVLGAFIAGGLGAAIGSLAGWATAAHPSDADVTGLVDLAAGAPTGRHATREKDAFGLRPTVMAEGRSPVHVTLDGARARLMAAGWHVEPIEHEVITGGTATTTREPALRATRGGVVAEVTVNETWDAVNVLARPTLPAVTGTLTAAGAALGLLMGWLLAARIGYRMREAPLWRRVAVGELALLAALALAWPTLTSWAYLLWPNRRVHLTDAYAAYELARPTVLVVPGGLALTMLAIVAAVLPGKAVLQQQRNVTTLP